MCVSAKSYSLTLYEFFNRQDLSAIETERNAVFYSKHTAGSPIQRFSVCGRDFCKSLRNSHKRHKKLLAIVSTFASREFVLVEVNKTKSQNSPTLKNSQKFVKWGQWFNTRSNSEKVINFEITDFSMYGDFLPKIDASFL